MRKVAIPILDEGMSFQAFESQVRVSKCSAHSISTVWAMQGCIQWLHEAAGCFLLGAFAPAQGDAHNVSHMARAGEGKATHPGHTEHDACCGTCISSATTLCREHVEFVTTLQYCLLLACLHMHAERLIGA